MHADWLIVGHYPPVMLMHVQIMIEVVLDRKKGNSQTAFNKLYNKLLINLKRLVFMGKSRTLASLYMYQPLCHLVNMAKSRFEILW